MIARKCDWCQNEYLAEQRYLNRGQGRFCTQRCAGLHNSAARSIEKPPNAQCGNCKTDLYRLPSKLNNKTGFVFCSAQCRADAIKNPDIEFKHGPAKKKSVYVKCKTDDCNFNTKNVYCRRCTKNNSIQKWLEGDIEITYTGVSRESKPWVKQYLIYTRGDACEVCDFSERHPDGSSIITMDHIDGNYLNNKIDNLRLLCPNHHAMTETFGSRNRNWGGREHRKGRVNRRRID